MYDRAKSSLLWLLKVPAEPLDPMGDVQTLRVFRAAPGYLRYLTLTWAISQLGLLAGVAALISVLAALAATSAPISAVAVALAMLALLVFLAQAALTYFSLRLNYEMRWYKVTDRSLRIRSGIFNVHEMTMTSANVQNIAITQGPLERLFGIADVKVQTAGGGGQSSPHGKSDGLAPNLHTAVFRGVDNPEEIRDLMLARLRRVRDAGLGDLDDARAQSPAAARHAGREILGLLAAFRDEAKAMRRAAEA